MVHETCFLVVCLHLPIHQDTMVLIEYAFLMHSPPPYITGATTNKKKTCGDLVFGVWPSIVVF